MYQSIHDLNGIDITSPSGPKRNIVLVGHDLQADISYLRQIGYEPQNLSNLIECTDTTHMYRAFRRDVNSTGLGKCLADLDIAGWNLHNAANDAVYTLQVMIAVAVKTLVEKAELRKKEKESIEKKIQEAMKLAADNVIEEKNGWSSGGEDSDGGAPEPLFHGKNKLVDQNLPLNPLNRESSGNVSSFDRAAVLAEKSSWRSGDGIRQIQKKEKRYPMNNW